MEPHLSITRFSKRILTENNPLDRKKTQYKEKKKINQTDMFFIYFQNRFLALGC